MIEQIVSWGGLLIRHAARQLKTKKFKSVDNLKYFIFPLTNQNESLIYKLEALDKAIATTTLKTEDKLNLGKI